MLIDTTMIKLKKWGAGVNLDYYLTILENSLAIYKEPANVEVKVMAEEPIDRKKIYLQHRNPKMQVFFL